MAHRSSHAKSQYLRLAKQRKRRAAGFIATALAGGTLFGTCQTRIHDSVINGTQIFILNLLDPSNVIIGDE